MPQDLSDLFVAGGFPPHIAQQLENNFQGNPNDPDVSIYSNATYNTWRVFEEFLDKGDTTSVVAAYSEPGIGHVISNGTVRGSAHSRVLGGVVLQLGTAANAATRLLIPNGAMTVPSGAAYNFAPMRKAMVTSGYEFVLRFVTPATLEPTAVWNIGFQSGTFDASGYPDARGLQVAGGQAQFIQRDGGGAVNALSTAVSLQPNTAYISRVKRSASNYNAWLTNAETGATLASVASLPGATNSAWDFGISVSAVGTRSALTDIVHIDGWFLYLPQIR